MVGTLSREMRKENLLPSDENQLARGGQELMYYEDYKGVRSFNKIHDRFSAEHESQFENMFRFNLIFLALLLVWGVSKAIRRAPEGYEDDSGFHFA